MTEYEKREKSGRERFRRDFGDRYIIEFTEDRFDKVDMYMTAATNSARTYVGEIKAYGDPQHPRNYTTYPDYMIDYDKLRTVKKIGLNEKRTPILACYFDDYRIIWDLNQVEWESTATWELVNCKGMDYGKKEYELMAHLSMDDAINVERTDDEERDN